MDAGNVSRARLLMVATASPSAIPSRRLKEMVAEGSWPEWFTDRGPTECLRLANEPNGIIGCAAAFCPVVERMFSIDSADGSFWNFGSISTITWYWLFGILIVDTCRVA